MQSPFAKYANTTLKLARAEYGDLTFDPETGNAIPATQTIQYKATLKASSSKDDLKLRELPGVDAGSVFFKGWIVGLVDPITGETMGLETAFLPEIGKSPVEMDAIIDGQEGRLFVLPNISSPFGVDLKTGQRIAGFFSYRK
jgi:hypothetical protein